VRSSDRARITALLLAVAGSAFALPAHAQHLGVIGPIYPLAEPSLLALIQSKLRELTANGGLERLQRESQARIRRQIEEPAPVAGLTRTATARTFHFDPSIEVPYPISDAEGRLIVAPGTRVNPLDVASLSRSLFFFDARDAEQVELARRELAGQRGHVKLILTGGSYLDLMRRMKQTVYYDQQGLLTTRLGIRQVPARVTQDGKRLRIDELR
jgi:conjugal transfer pilus assembly protein TraW